MGGWQASVAMGGSGPMWHRSGAGMRAERRWAAARGATLRPARCSRRPARLSPPIYAACRHARLLSPLRAARSRTDPLSHFFPVHRRARIYSPHLSGKSLRRTKATPMAHANGSKVAAHLTRLLHRSPRRPVALARRGPAAVLPAGRRPTSLKKKIREVRKEATSGRTTAEVEKRERASWGAAVAGVLGEDGGFTEHVLQTPEQQNRQVLSPDLPVLHVNMPPSGVRDADATPATHSPACEGNSIVTEFT
uniref:Uncharacterized protein n=1 Tax=Oryza nivara TaxID=4536 RepID=A0A0E0IL84_ORYNI